MRGWAERVELRSIFDDDTTTVEQKAQAVAARLRPLLDRFPDDDAGAAVDDLAHSVTTEDEVDAAMYELWNWGDANRIWIGVI